MDIVKLNGVIKPYLWGDKYFISSLLGTKKPEHPQGELWIGTHTMGEASLLEDDTLLSDYLHAYPTELLGPSHLKRFHEELPFLLKVLAIKDPLSLQVHPNEDQARRGYQKESDQREVVDPSQLNYKDDKQKDEVLLAITPITAVVGFRKIGDILENLSQILVQHPDLFIGCATSEEFFKKLITLDDQMKRELLDELKTYLEIEREVDASLFLNSVDIAKRALMLYPEDIMCFASFFLNVVHLSEGEAIHVKPTTLHAYIYGHGVELMSSSDNVLRGGLTSKKIDVDELLSTLSFYEGDSVKVTKIEHSKNFYSFNVPSKEFIFSYFEKGKQSVEQRDTLEIALVIEGNGKITWDNKEIRYKKGDILLIPAIIGTYTIENSGLVVLASVPREN